MVAQVPAITIESSLPVLAEERVLLYNISWETFERLLAEVGDRRHTHFHFWHNRLEIMSPLARHEGSNRFIDDLIRALADELDLNLRKLGSLTLKRRDRKAGGEPDSCYYIQNEPAVRQYQDIDLQRDPPPDLVLEIDITSPSDSRFPIYASLGVPELWKYDGHTLQYYTLQQGRYVAVDRSPTFPDLPAATVVEYLDKRFEVGEMQALRAFRAWVRQTIGPTLKTESQSPVPPSTS